jgi:transcriptional regulator with XRE-family HTH domain
MMSQKRGVASLLDKQLGDFLRRRRGGQTFAEFSRKLGLPASTLHRLEQYQQSITLGRLYQITRRLKCRLRDIFSDRAW